MPKDIRIEHLRGIVMRAPGITDTTEFYTGLWGVHVAHQEDGITYLRGTGDEPFIYGLKDGATYGVEYVHFGMPDRESIDALHAQLSKKAVDWLGAPGEFKRFIHIAAGLCFAATAQQNGRPSVAGRVGRNGTPFDRFFQGRQGCAPAALGNLQVEHGVQHPGRLGLKLVGAFGIV